MSLDFSTIKEITIPEGSVKKIVSGDVTLWEKISEIIREFMGYPIQTAYSLAGNSINWKLYGNSVQRLLPEGYTQLAYIESTGTQYIDTEVLIASGYKVRVKYLNNTGGTAAAFGCTTIASSGNASRGIARVTGDVNRLAWGSGTGTVVGITGYNSSNVWYDTICDDGVWTINGDTVTTITTIAFTSVNSMALFSRHTGDSFTLLFKGRISICQIWDENGVLLLDLVPSKNSSDVIGFYDTISGRFFTNAGTGSFIAGAEAPTPEAPIEIKSVGDRTVNLFDETAVTIGKFYNDSGVLTTNSVTYYSDKISATQGDVFTLSREAIATNVYLRIHAFKADGTWIAMVGKSSGASSLSVTSSACPANTAYIIACGAAVAQSIDTKTMVVKGSTVTSYVPYGYQIPINVSGKNLFDGVSNIVLGKYIASSTGDISTDSHNFYCETYFEVKPNTSYAFWGEKKEDTTFSKYNRIYWYDNSKTFISSAQYAQSAKCVGISPNNAKYVRISCNPTDLGTLTQEDMALFNWYLGEGSTATPYEPYHTPTTTPIYLSNPLRKVGTYADYIDYENQRIVRNVGVKVLDGTEDWDYNNIRFSMILGDAPQSDNNIAVCSHYKNVIGITPVTDMSNQTFKLNSLNRQLIFKDSSFTTLSAWTTFLATQYANGTPVTIVYPLATSTTESLTVPNITLSEGTNIITTDTQIKPSDGYLKCNCSR